MTIAPNELCFPSEDFDLSLQSELMPSGFLCRPAVSNQRGSLSWFSSWECLLSIGYWRDLLLGVVSGALRTRETGGWCGLSLRQRHSNHRGLIRAQTRQNTAFPKPQLFPRKTLGPTPSNSSPRHPRLPPSSQNRSPPLPSRTSPPHSRRTRRIAASR